MKHYISLWNQIKTQKLSNVFCVVLARAVHVSICSRGQPYKTVFGCLTLYTESLLGLKVISLFQAFSSFISTVSIHLSGSYLSPSTVQCLLNAVKNMWECSRRANKERNFSQFFEVIYQTERFFARKFEFNFRSKGIFVRNFASLETIGLANYHDFSLKIRFLRKARKSEFRRNTFALVLHNTVL